MICSSNRAEHLDHKYSALNAWVTTLPVANVCDLGSGDVNNKSLVSVIIIFLNAEKFIQEAIESVFAQTYDNWELLLVDDGSTDAGTEIALRYAEQYPTKVCYLEHNGHQNRGMSASRNLGIMNAKGEYIAFLDADDVWLPHKLEQQVAILGSYPEAAMIYGPALWWHSWAGNATTTNRDAMQKLGVQPDSLIEPPTLLTLFLQNEDFPPSPSGILVRRQAIQDGFAEAFRGMYEDQVFFAKLCLEAPVFVASACWYKYRQHPDACCSVAMHTGQYYPARLTFLTWLAAYLSRQQDKHIEVWSVLQKELRAKGLQPYRHPVLYRLLGCGKQRIGQAKRLLKSIVRRTLPAPVRLWLRIKLNRYDRPPPVGWVRLGALRRLQPIRRTFGWGWGQCIDRYYIEIFLAEHASDIHGHVLEIGGNDYTRQFGKERVIQSDVLHAPPGTPQATIVADLTCADSIPSETFDCIILTQTLQFIYDVRAALRTLHRILKPGGVLLATCPGISQIARYDMDRWGEYWRFTSLSALKFFTEVFPEACVTVQPYGNVLTAIAFLHGLVAQELRQQELDYHDRDYEVILTVRAVKPQESQL
jgi:glycosyltransferase involved in cell wall biosynthesis/SAM-dependent methyltransferase